MAFLTRGCRCVRVPRRSTLASLGILHVGPSDGERIAFGIDQRLFFRKRFGIVLAVLTRLVPLRPISGPFPKPSRSPTPWGVCSSDISCL